MSTSDSPPNDDLRPTRLQVDLGQIRRNYRALCTEAKGARVMPILKANAYGHGLIPVASVLAESGAQDFGVAYLEEALTLRQAGIHTNILVLGGIVGNQIPQFIESDLTLTASSVEKLQAIDQAATAMGEEAKVHLKIDTGMERIGTHWYSASTLLEASLRCRSVKVTGIYSHLSCADESDLSTTSLQLERFEEVCQFYPNHGIPTPTRHIANSSAMLRMSAPIWIWFDRASPVLEYPPSSQPLPSAIRPAMRWISRVVYFKVIRPGPVSVTVGNGPPDRLTRIVTIPVGYGDGYLRSMSGKAHVLIHGRPYPVVGSICMDQLMVNIGWDEAFNGDEVVLMGGQDEQHIGPEDLAGWAGTILVKY